MNTKPVMKMANTSNSAYRSIPFSDETPKDEFYTFSDASQLQSVCDEDMVVARRFRTIGVMFSENGRYYLESIEPSKREDSRIQVSMVFMDSGVRSAVLPQTVQVFGELMWRNRPVLMARIVMVMSASTAIKMNKSLNEVTQLHRAITMDTHPFIGT